MPARSCTAIYKLVHCLIILQRLLRLNSVSFPVARTASLPLKQIEGKQAVQLINSKLLPVLCNRNSMMFKHEIEQFKHEI